MGEGVISSRLGLDTGSVKREGRPSIDLSGKKLIRRVWSSVEREVGA